MKEFAAGLDASMVLSPHLMKGMASNSRDYLADVEREWDGAGQPLTILEFTARLQVKEAALVHYSGAEDRKYSGEEQLDDRSLEEWANEQAEQKELSRIFRVPQAGELRYI